MFDTMTLTKLLGAFCGTLLVFLLGGWAAESIYREAEHGEGHEQAYVIEVEEAGDGDEVTEEAVDFGAILASADPAEGESLFRNCRSCHSLEPGVNGTGPSLFGAVGRPVAAVEGFNYTDAIQEAADVWSPENLNHFIESPRDFAPGTAMTYAGMRRVEDRAHLIAYLATIAE